MSNRQQRRESNARSAQIRQQTIGSHVRRESQRARHTKVKFGNQRKQTRASRGEITHVVPRTRTRESAAHYSRRTHSPDYVEAELRRSRRRRCLTILLVVLLAAVAVAGVTTFVYNQSVNGKMGLSDSNATAALTVPASDTDPYWVLLAGEYEAAGREYDGPHLLELVRVDPVNTKVTFLWVPVNTRVSLSDGNTHNLSEAQVLGGDAELIEAVESFAGVSISHYAKINQEGFVSLIDSLGGVSVNLPEEVDDPYAGIVFIPAGEQILDGASALVAARASNYTEPLAVQSQVQASIAQALLQQVVDKGGIAGISTFDAIADDFKTDLTYSSISDLVAPFEGKQATVESASIPGTVSEEGGVEYYSVSSSGLNSLVATIEAGGSVYEQPSTAGVDAAGVTVTVRNGASINGAATAAASQLTAAGFQVPETGNTESAVYTETLIVYSSENEAAAQAVASTLGQGRITDASNYYSFSTDVLVIIGSNWIS